MTKTPTNSRPPRAKPKLVPRPDLQRDDEVEQVILKPRRLPLSRPALHSALDTVVAAWITAACTWDEADIGDCKFVIFSTDVAPGTEVYVQFWSEPLDPVLWEVSSGKWNPLADQWLAGARSERIAGLGFRLGGEAENYQREVTIDSPAAAARIAAEVVEVFYSGFDYRGATPLRAKLAYEGRSVLRATFDAFGPAELTKLFAGCGYRVEEAEPGHDGELPMLRCRKRGIATIVEFGEPAPDDDGLFGRVTFSCELEVRPEDVPDLPPAPEHVHDAVPVLAISTVLLFKGGVTAEWVVTRIQEWSAMIASRTVKAKRRLALVRKSTAVVH